MTDQPQSAGEVRKATAFDAQKGKGRVKGVPNKTTMIAKDAIATAAERLGGVDRLVAWAREDDKNESVFWASIYPKLLPLQVTGGDGGALEITLTSWFDGRGTEQR